MAIPDALSGPQPRDLIQGHALPPVTNGQPERFERQVDERDSEEK